MNLIETLHYPVVIHYYGDDELEYVASAQQLQDLSASFVCDDQVIEQARENVFALRFQEYKVEKEK